MLVKRVDRWKTTSNPKNKEIPDCISTDEEKCFLNLKKKTKQYRCSLCLELGHNKATCDNDEVPVDIK